MPSASGDVGDRCASRERFGDARQAAFAAEEAEMKK
jgi:hypothetical protein